MLNCIDAKLVQLDREEVASLLQLDRERTEAAIADATSFPGVFISGATARYRSAR